MRSFCRRLLTGTSRALVITLPLTAPSFAAAPTIELVYVGTQHVSPPQPKAGNPDPVDKATRGIYQMRLDLKTGALSTPTVAYELDHATWLTPHPRLPVVYAVASTAGEQADSEIHSFKVDKANERLEFLNKVD